MCGVDSQAYRELENRNLEATEAPVQTLHTHSERMEARRLLSASVVNGTLQVNGTNSSDQITVSLLGQFVRVDMNAEPARSFEVTQIQRVSVAAGAGSDSVSLVETQPSG